MRHACLDADARLIQILQLKISSPRKQSHFVKYRATQIVFRAYFRAVSKGVAGGNQGRSSSSISSPWSLQVQSCIWFCSLLAKEIICAYFNANFVMFQQFWCVKFWENFWRAEIAGFTLLHLVCIWGWYFLAAHTHVLCMGSGSATGFFPAPRFIFFAFFAKIFFQISVVILNSTLHSQIFEFDISIQNFRY